MPFGQDEEGPTLSANPPDWTCESVAKALGYTDKAALSAELDAVDDHGYRLRVRKGQRKRRVIAEPRVSLKLLQKRVLRLILERIPPSTSVFSRRRRGVIENASQHLGGTYMTVLDVSSCYASTTAAMVRAALARLGVNEEVRSILTRISTLRGFIPQGAPTSQALVDFVFVAIDAELLGLATKYGATYTRYGDDLAFSGPYELLGLDGGVIAILRRHGYHTSLHKRRVWAGKSRHIVTGIVVGKELRPTPQFLYKLDRQFSYRLVSRYRLRPAQVEGMVAWTKQVNRALGRGVARKLAKRSPTVAPKRANHRETRGVRPATESSDSERDSRHV